MPTEPSSLLRLHVTHETQAEGAEGKGGRHKKETGVSYVVRQDSEITCHPRNQTPVGYVDDTLKRTLEMIGDLAFVASGCIDGEQ